MVGLPSPDGAIGIRKCHDVARQPTLRDLDQSREMVTSQLNTSLSRQSPAIAINSAPKGQRRVGQGRARVDQPSPEGAELNSSGWSAAEPRVVAASET
jgi:hypothetical protein